MRPTRWRALLVVAVVVGVVAWGVLRAWTDGGHELPDVPWTAPVGLLVIAVSVLAFGLPVRRWTSGAHDRALDPLRAARTVVLAKAAQYSGSALVGWYLAQVVVVLPDVDVSARRGLLVRGLVGAVAAMVVLLVGRLVERWCRVPHDRDEPPNGTAA